MPNPPPPPPPPERTEWAANQVPSPFPPTPYYPGIPMPYYVRPPVLAPVDDEWAPLLGFARRPDMRDVRPEFARAGTARPEFARPEFARSDMTRPDMTRPEFARPDMTRPEIVAYAPEGPAAEHESPPKRGRPVPTQRKRSATACDHCRHKKIKCDNVRPKCGACSRNGHECVYRTDAYAVPMAHDAHAAVMARLDSIAALLRPRRRARRAAVPLQWDMSLTHMLRWRFLRSTLELSADDVAHDTRRLLTAYERNNTRFALPQLSSTRILVAAEIETFVAAALPQLVNSFLLNCHTKVPCVDTVHLFETLSVYTVMLKADPETRISTILAQAADLAPGEVLEEYLVALTHLDLSDNRLRRRAFGRFCASVPLILVICALGVLLTEVRFDNFCEFALSVEERRSMQQVPLSPASLPADRMQLALVIVHYASVIQYVFPGCMVHGSLITVQYHILLSQFYITTMNPLAAHREIVTASTLMMYYLQKDRVEPRLRAHPLADTPLTVERLFWTCLKLECELQSELSPYVAGSGITKITAPLLFLKLPSPPAQGDNLADCVQMASKYDDKHLWLFFLTEIAVRKLDNLLFDQLYPHEPDPDAHPWDDPQFAHSRVWQLVIKYLDQYNGIIGSLPPDIRNFVMLEEDPDRMLARIKRAEKKWKGKTEGLEADPESEHFGLDEFAVDSNTLLQLHSESVMFIKTRILTSKLALFRPLLYLILEDKILLPEVVEAATAVLGRATEESRELLQTPEDSSSSDHNTTNSAPSVASNFFGDEIPGYTNNNIYQQRFPDEDFSRLIEYPDYDDSDDDECLPVISDVVLARKQLLRVLVRNLVILPKLNVQAIWLHRHAGSWYYIRNFFFGVTIQFLLYKKVQAVLAASAAGGMRPMLQEMVTVLVSIFSRESTQKALALALLMMNYWKEELRDCEVLAEYLQLCLDKL